MNEKIGYEWDGETIKQKIEVPDKKITPKEMLEFIDKLNAEINQMKNQQSQYENAVSQLKVSLRKSEETLSKWKEFEVECERLQIEKLKKTFESIKAECVEKAIKETDKEVSANPHEMTQEQIDNSRYVKFRQMVTQHEKVSNKICKRIITKHLYETPFFDNPFVV